MDFTSKNRKFKVSYKGNRQIICLEFNIKKGNESTTIIDEKRLF